MVGSEDNSYEDEEHDSSSDDNKCSSDDAVYWVLERSPAWYQHRAKTQVYGMIVELGSSAFEFPGWQKEEGTGIDSVAEAAERIMAGIAAKHLYDVDDIQPLFVSIGKAYANFGRQCHYHRRETLGVCSDALEAINSELERIARGLQEKHPDPIAIITQARINEPDFTVTLYQPGMVGHEAWLEDYLEGVELTPTWRDITSDVLEDYITFAIIEPIFCADQESGSVAQIRRAYRRARDFSEGAPFQNLFCNAIINAMNGETSENTLDEVVGDVVRQHYKITARTRQD